MNATSKKLLSLLIVVAMVLSMSPVITLPAAAVANPGAGKAETVTAWEAENASKFANGGEVKATCPICGGEQTWEPKNNADYGIKSGNHHYYLEEELNLPDITYLFNGYSGQTICFYMNKNITTSGNIRVYGTINMFGSGTYTYNGGNDKTMFEFISGTTALNIYGGTYTNKSVGVATNGATLGMIAPWAGKPTSIYGGTFNTGDIAFFRPWDTNGSELYIYGGTINGGNACVIDLSAKKATTLEMYGGEIHGGSAAKGGNVYVGLGTTFNMYGGKIYDGEATSFGGNIYVDTSSTLNMSGNASIYDGICGSRGTDVMVEGGTMTMADNAAVTGKANGMVVEIEYKSGSDGAALTMSGNASVTSQQGGTALRIYNTSVDKVVFADGWAGQTYLWISTTGYAAGDKMPACVELQGNISGTIKAMFANGDETAQFDVKVENGELILQNPAGEEPEGTEKDQYEEYTETKDRVDAWVANNSGATFESGYCPVCDAMVEWVAVDTGTDDYQMLRDSKHYYLSGDVDYTGTDWLYINRENTQNTCIYLNNKTLTINNGFRLYGTVNFIGGDGKITRPADSTGANQMFFIMNGTAVTNIYGGTYENKTTKDMFYGDYSGVTYNLYGASFKSSGIFFNMAYATNMNLNDTDVEVSGSQAIIMTRAGTVNMVGGSITGGNVNKNGGNILMNAGEFNMSGDAEIYGGKSQTWNGGNVYMSAGKFTMTDTAKIYNGSNGWRGGNVEMTGGTFEMSGNAKIYGGNITDNNKTGGNVSVLGGSFSMTDNAEIYGGKSNASGGNIYVSDAALTMSGDAVIRDGDGSTSDTPNVYLNGSTMIMSGNAKVIATENGGVAGNGVFVSRTGATGTGSKLILSGNATVTTRAQKPEKALRIYATDPAEVTDKLFITNDWAGTAYVYLSETYASGATIPSHTIECGTYAAGTMTAAGTYSGKLFVSDKDSRNVYAYGENGAVKFGAPVSVVTETGAQYFKTATEALAAYKTAGDAYLLLSESTEVAIDGNVYVDLNGQAGSFTGTGKVFAIETDNDDYVGYGSFTVAEGIEVAIDVVSPVTGYRYITILDEDDQANAAYTTHRIEVKLTNVTLRPTATGMYYKSEYKCDDKLASRVTTYGVVLSAKDVPNANFLAEPTDGFSILTEGFTPDENHAVKGVSGALFGLMKESFDTLPEGFASVAAYNKYRAEAKVYANAYFMVDVNNTQANQNDDFTVMGDIKNQDTTNGVGYSLLDVLKYIDSHWTDYAEYQQSVKDFYAIWNERGIDWDAEFANIDA